MKKFTFEYWKYWYPSGSWDKESKVIEAEDEQSARLQIQYGGISKVRNLKLIKVDDADTTSLKYFKVTCNSDSFPSNEVGHVVMARAENEAEAKSKAENYLTTEAARRFARSVGISESMRNHPEFSLTPKFRATSVMEVGSEYAEQYLVIDSKCSDSDENWAVKKTSSGNFWTGTLQNTIYTMGNGKKEYGPDFDSVTQLKMTKEKAEDTANTFNKNYPNSEFKAVKVNDSMGDCAMDLRVKDESCSRSVVDENKPKYVAGDVVKRHDETWTIIKSEIKMGHINYYAKNSKDGFVAWIGPLDDLHTFDMKSVADGSLAYKTLKIGQMVRIDPANVDKSKLSEEDLNSVYEVKYFYFNQQPVYEDPTLNIEEYLRTFSGVRIKNKKSGNETDVNRFQLMDSKLADTALTVGQTLTGKEGKIKITKVDAGFSDYDGSPIVNVDYDYETTDGKKGSSRANSKDIFKMVHDSVDKNGYINPPKSDDEFFKSTKEERIATLQNVGAPNALVEAAKNGKLWEYFVAHESDQSYWRKDSNLGDIMKYSSETDSGKDREGQPIPVGTRVFIYMGKNGGKIGTVKSWEGPNAIVECDGTTLKYVGNQDLIKDSKMFKVTDTKTGAVRLVRAADSMNAIQKVSAVKDADIKVIYWTPLLDYLRANFGIAQQKEMETGGRLFKFNKEIGESDLNLIERKIYNLLNSDNVRFEETNDGWWIIDPYFV